MTCGDRDAALTGLMSSRDDGNPQLTLWANDLTPLTGLWIPAFAGMTRKGEKRVKGKKSEKGVKDEKGAKSRLGGHAGPPLRRARGPGGN
jgi:hypothetical protein